MTAEPPRVELVASVDGGTSIQAGRDVHATIVQETALAPRGPAVHLLPRDLRTLVDREEVIASLVTGAASGHTAIGTISGTAGIGKTAVAIRVAHALVPHYPDGQFFVDLRGHRPGATPAEPADVLATLLIDLGIHPRHIPDGLDARRDLWRDRVSHQRILVVLDDARDQGQVDPLLPSGSHCFTLVTSRRRFVAMDDAVPTPLDMLPTEDAAQLFRNLSGRRTWPAADLAAVVQLVECCEGLPLALVLLAGRLAHHPSWSIADYAAEFTGAEDRLGELTSGTRAVGAAFEMSYRAVPTGRQQFFRRLALHPGTDIDAHAAAALHDCSVATARRELEALYEDHFVDEKSPGRFRTHDLLREYARTLLARDPALESAEAVRRLIAHYADIAELAEQFLGATTRPTRRAGVGTAPTGRSGPRDFAAALRWLRAERANLLACVEYAWGIEHFEHLFRLTSSLAGLLRLDGPWEQAARLHSRVAEYARTGGDQLAYGNALNDLAVVRDLTGAHAEARDLLTEALETYRRIEHRTGEGNALNNIGHVLHELGEFDHARSLLRAALAIFEESGDRLGRATAGYNLGLVAIITGDYRTAAAELTAARELYAAIDQPLCLAETVNELGTLSRLSGDYPAAVAYHEQALDLCRTIGNPLGEAQALHAIGILHQITGDYPAAIEVHRSAVAAFRQLGNRRGEADAVHHLGIGHRLAADYPAAVAQQDVASALARDTGNPALQANCRVEQGRVHRLTGDFAAATELLADGARLHAQAGDLVGEAYALGELGLVLRRRGDYRQALDLQTRSLTIGREVGHRICASSALVELAHLHCTAGDAEAATAHADSALADYRAAGDRFGEANALVALGRIRDLDDDRDEAGRLFSEARDIYRSVGTRAGEIYAVNFLAGLATRGDDLDTAAELFTGTLADAAGLHDTYEEAHALAGLAEVARRRGAIDEALAHLSAAVALYDRLGAAEHDDATRRLVAWRVAAAQD
ncbi:tetratricopeptide repeat protein [Nocardia sp. NPDC058379]|uniref:tetratricopeptide repeat protein n=1 Tax=unclassified Nocardia TaxID=2637762 RepID=UPI00364A7AF9